MGNVIDWKPVLSCGIPFMDDDHRQVVDHITAFKKLLPTGNSDAVCQAFRALLNLLKCHFASEETAMRQYHLPAQDYLAHKQEHDAFMAQLDFFSSRLERCTTLPLADLAEFITTWIVAHILGQDRKIGMRLRDCAMAAE